MALPVNRVIMVNIKCRESKARGDKLRGERNMEEKIILLVEDNPDDVVLTLRAFRKNNILNRVVVVEDGEQALDYFFGPGREGGLPRGDIPQVILLDLNLPKVSGLEVLKKLREREETRLIPVVILTSSREERDMVEGYSQGANSYIQKPVDYLQFHEAVRRLGIYWLVMNVPPPVERR